MTGRLEPPEIAALLPDMRAFARGLAATVEAADELVARTVLDLGLGPDEVHLAVSPQLRAFSALRRNFHSGNVADATADASGSARFDAAFHALPSRLREALVLTRGARLTARDAALVCETDAATLNGRVDEARDRLAAALAGGPTDGAENSGIPSRKPPAGGAART